MKNKYQEIDCSKSDQSWSCWKRDSHFTSMRTKILPLTKVWCYGKDACASNNILNAIVSVSSFYSLWLRDWSYFRFHCLYWIKYRNDIYRRFGDFRLNRQPSSSHIWEKDTVSFLIIGTRAQNKQNMPKFENLEKDETIHLHKDNLMAFKWQDKRDCTLRYNIAWTWFRSNKKIKITKPTKIFGNHWQ